MTPLLLVFRDLLFLRAGPQDLPHSPQLLGLLLVVSVIADLAVATALGVAATGMARTLLALVVLVGMPALALAMAGRAARFVQTATALVSTALVISVVAAPLQLGVGILPVDQQSLSPGQVVMVWLILALQVMQLAVFGNILRHALDVPLRRGVLLAIAMLIVFLVLNATMIGPDTA